MFTPEGESPVTKGFVGKGVGLRSEGRGEGPRCLTTTHSYRPSVWGQVAHLWGQTGIHSRECGSKACRHAGTQKESLLSSLPTPQPLLLNITSFLPCSPPRDSQQSGSSCNVGTSGRVGANFCPKTSPSQLLVENSGSSSIVGAGQGQLPALNHLPTLCCLNSVPLQAFCCHLPK